MSAVIQRAESPALPFLKQETHNLDARRWMWSASVREDLSAYPCGHSYIERQSLMPVNTYSKVIPTEIPAVGLDSGHNPIDMNNPYGATFSTVRIDNSRSLTTQEQATQTVLRRTAAGLCHDILLGVNTLGQQRGIGEIEAFRGLFETAAEEEELSALYEVILPHVHRQTLKKALAWLTALNFKLEKGIENELDRMPAPIAQYVSVAEKAVPQFLNLAREAKNFITSWVNSSEAEVQQYANTGKGKDSLDDFDRHCLFDLERVEAPLKAAQASLDGNAALGDRIGASIIEGLKMNAQPPTVTSEQFNDLLAKFAAQEEKLEQLAAQNAAATPTEGAETEKVEAPAKPAKAKEKN